MASRKSFGSDSRIETYIFMGVPEKHAYFDINLDILWKTVTEDIPLLIDNLEKVLPPNEIQ